MLVRGLVAACVLLAALCVVQWRTLDRLKSELAAAERHALESSIGERRDELVRAMIWLDGYTRSAEGLQRPAGLCPDGRPDADAVGRWIFDVYVRARIFGASEADARRRVTEAIRSAQQASR